MKNIFCIVIFLAFLFSISSAGFAEESTTIDKDWKFSHLLANHEWPKDITPRDLGDRKFHREYSKTLNEDLYYSFVRDFYNYESIESFGFSNNRLTSIRYVFSNLKDLNEAMELYNELISYLSSKFPDITANPGYAFLNNKKIRVVIFADQKTPILVLSFFPYEQ